MTTDAKPMPKIVPRWQRVLVYSRFGRVLIFVAMFLSIASVILLLAGMAGWLRKETPGLQALTDVLIRVFASLGAYLLLVYGIEKRRPEEMRLRRFVPHLAAGFALGFAFIGSVIAVLWMLGVYQVTGMGTEVHWAIGFFIAGVGPAVSEEIIFRGVMFRLAEERWGMWRALALSALFFGFVHIGNEGATLWSSLAIAIEAGVLLGLLYHVTRSLWVCMGLHCAWNFFEGTVFGSSVSGFGTGKFSWLQAQFSGPEWLTGGRFGIEASVVTVVLSLLFSAALLYIDNRRKRQPEPEENQDDIATGMAPC